MEKGVERWVVDVSKWNPSPDHFSFVTSFLPQPEHSSITRYVKMVDRKRALISRLLQYAVVHQVLGIPFDEIVIRRTIEGKPYLEFDDRTLEFPNFNFNTSHDGDYVAIASEPLCLVGIDIVNLSTPSNESVDDFIHNFSIYFSKLEWSDIMKADSSTGKLNAFYRYWCLKESYVKAIGNGVGSRLDSVEFHHTSWKDIFVVVDGRELKDWRFWLLELGNQHLVSIAKGNPKAATTNYRRSLKQTEFGKEEYNAALNYPNVDFVMRMVEDLLPISSGINWDVSLEPKVSEDEEISEEGKFSCNS